MKKYKIRNFEKIQNTAGWAGWAGLGWAGLGWAGLGWANQGWARLGEQGYDGLGRGGLDPIVLNFEKYSIRNFEKIRNTEF